MGLDKGVCGIVLRDVMGVDHRRLDIRVAHERLHVRERKRLDSKRAKGMAQAVKAHPRESRGVKCGIEPSP